MKVYLCTPSARSKAEAQPIIDMWKQRGYGICLWRDVDAEPLDGVDLLIEGAYPGHAASSNACCQLALRDDLDCDWCVIAGDDTEPDPNHTADEIALECKEHFRGSTYGVMQPTGDRFAGGSIDRICGSPFVGRKFIERTYGGMGPFWHEYWHMFNDEELQNVAQDRNVLWQRRELIHMHRHFQRQSRAVNSDAVSAAIPSHLVRANSRENWDAMKAIFERRSKAGFPGAFDGGA